MVTITKDNIDSYIKSNTYFRLILRRFYHNKFGVAMLIIVILISLISFIGPHLLSYKYYIYTSDASVSPSLSHIMGTDELGYDIFSRILHGTQRTLYISISTGFLSIILGGIYGMLAALSSKSIANLLMRLIDLILILPIIAVAALILDRIQSASSLTMLVFILTLFSSAYVARVVYGDVLLFKKSNYIISAKAIGASKMRIFFLYIAPNALHIILVNIVVIITGSIIAETSLSYLGFGIHVPDVSLGTLINQGINAQFNRWWLFYFPIGWCLILVVSISFLGDSIRKAFDIRES